MAGERTLICYPWRMVPLHHSIAVIALLCASAGAARAQVATQWNFDGDLNAAFGAAELDYESPQTEGAVSFGDAQTLAAPTPDGANPGVIALETFNRSSLAFVCRHDAPANGTGTFVNDYTLIWDLYVPQASFGNNKWLSLYNTNCCNENDGDHFVDLSDGSFGIGELSYGGAVLPDTWHRLAITFETRGGDVAHHRYIDGVEAGGGTTAIDGRFSIYAMEDPTYQWFHVMADDNGQMEPCALASFYFADWAWSAAELAALGGVSGAGATTPATGSPDAGMGSDAATAPDVATTPDTSTVADAATAADTATAGDASPPPDSSSFSDASASPDVATIADAAVVIDADTMPDAGTTPDTATASDAASGRDAVTAPDTGFTLIARAGQDRTVQAPAEVVLDGSDSQAPPAAIFTWTCVERPGGGSAEVVGEEKIAAVHIDEPGFWSYQLTVTSGSVSDSDIVSIMVEVVAPTASEGCGCGSASEELAAPGRSWLLAALLAALSAVLRRRSSARRF